MASTNNQLPEHLWYNIFVLLPVKSLLLLRPVCKHWNQVIGDKSFIKFHLAHNKASSNTNKCLLLWNEKDPNPALDHNLPFLTTLVDSKTYSNVLESHMHDMHDIFGRDSAGHGLEVYGICDGLLCLSVPKNILKADSPIFLWNPVVKKGKKLPPIETGKYPYIDTCYLCFGYHSGDYKVINMVPYRPTVYQIHVYSLSTDHWKKLRIRNNIGSTIHGNGCNTWSYPKARLVNGSAYFVQYPSSSTTSTRQVAFYNLSREIIQQINMPDDFHFVNLEEHGKSIALIGYGGGVVGPGLPTIGFDLVMWVLRVGDHSFSWDKKFTIKAENKRRFSPMGFISIGKLVIKRFIRPKPYTDEYFLYDVETESKLEYTPPVRPSYLVENRTSPLINGLTESLVLLTETTTPCTKMQPGSSNATTSTSGYKKPRKRKTINFDATTFFSIFLKD